MNYFDQINYFIRSTESSFVNLLSSVAPWLAPLAPAYMTFYHMTGELDYPIVIAMAIAGVVEVLGLASISTILAFWAHNKRYKKDGKRAPIGLAVFTFVLYLVIILTVNVFMDASKYAALGINPVYVQIGARAMLNLMTIPAAMILGIRTTHKELLDSIEEEREQRKAERRQARETRQVQTERRVERMSSTKKKDFFDDLRTGRLQEYLAQNNLEFSATAIAEVYQISERNAFRWMAEAKQRSA